MSLGLGAVVRSGSWLQVSQPEANNENNSLIILFISYYVKHFCSIAFNFVSASLLLMVFKFLLLLRFMYYHLLLLIIYCIVYTLLSDR